MKKEWFEWIHSWCEATTQDDLSRVLLVGDSITHGYQDKVRQALKGVCYVDYIATSYAIDSKMYTMLVENFAKDSRYDVIHFNHGLHGIHLSKRGYASRMKKLLCRLEKQSNVLLTTTMVVYTADNKRLHSKWNKRVQERNEVVWDLAKEKGYAVDDLYAVSLTIDKADRSTDGTHYESAGYETLAQSVANSIKKVLGK